MEPKFEPWRIVAEAQFAEDEISQLIGDFAVAAMRITETKYRESEVTNVAVVDYDATARACWDYAEAMVCEGHRRLAKARRDAMAEFEAKDEVQAAMSTGESGSRGDMAALEEDDTPVGAEEHDVVVRAIMGEDDPDDPADG